MLVSRRFGDQDVTARLEGVRYIVGRVARAKAEEEDGSGGAPAVPAHLQATLDAVRAGAGPSGHPDARPCWWRPAAPRPP